MATAHSRQRGRVLARLVLRRRRAKCGTRPGGAERDGCAVEKSRGLPGGFGHALTIDRRSERKEIGLTRRRSGRLWLAWDRLAR